MSDYVREKVLRYPAEPSYFGVKSLHDLEEKDEYKDIVDYREEGKFSPASTTKKFIDYVLYTTYGEDSGDYGKVRELYDSEKIKYRPIFQKLIPDVDMEKFGLWISVGITAPKLRITMTLKKMSFMTRYRE